jgi:hypothetical protein
MDRPLPFPTPTPTADATPARIGLAVWLALALAVSLSGVLTLERRFLVPITIATLVVTQVALYARGGAWRTLADATSTRALVLFHAIRAPIGAAFLVLMAHGLDATFARVAGVGDLVAGSLAVVVGAFFARSRAVVLAWNAVALADIVLVVFTAQRVLVFSDHPQTMGMLVHFPGTLLPTFVVPFVIASHLLLFARLRRAAR